MLPHRGVTVLSQTLIVESIDLSNLSRLVVTAKDRNSLAIPDLQGNEKGHCLYGVISSVDIVSHEQVVGVGRLSSNFEEFLKIVKLAVDISADRDWRVHSLNVGLIL